MADAHPLMDERTRTSYSRQLRVARLLHLGEDLHVLPLSRPSAEQRVWLQRVVDAERRDMEDFCALVRAHGPLREYMDRARGTKRDPRSMDLVERVLRASVNFAPSGSGVVIRTRTGAAGGGRVLTVLTCAHCIPGEGLGSPNLALDANGREYVTECVAYDAVADLALVELSVADEDAGASILEPLPVADAVEAYPRPVMVCGNPVRPGRGGYLPFHVSTGQARDVAEGDVDTSVENRGFGYGTELGGLRHNAWTFWGHSGSPIVDTETGAIIGIHNSWDPLTAWRHGVSLPVLRRFLAAH